MENFQKLIILLILGIVIFLALICLFFNLPCPNCKNIKLKPFFRDTKGWEEFLPGEFLKGKILAWVCPNCKRVFEDMPIKFNFKDFFRKKNVSSSSGQ